jgi:hypothetical protein
VIFSIRNRYLRGLAGWLMVVGFVLAFPFIVVVGASWDAINNLREWWRESREDRRWIWGVLLFRSEQ